MRQIGAILGMVAFVASAAAQETSVPKPRFDFTGASDAELWSAYLAAVKRNDTDFCGFHVPLLSQIETRGGADKRVSISRSGAELECAVEQRQWDVAYRQVKYLEGAREKLEPLYTASIARLAGALSDASIRLIEHVDAMEPGTASDEEFQQLGALERAFLESGRPTERLQLLRDLTTEQRLAKMAPVDRQTILARRFTAEVETGDISAATELVENVRNPHVILSALSDRRYESLWPQLEMQAGDNLHRILNANVAETLAQYNATPDDNERLQKLAHAYLYAGQFSEVIDLVDARRPSSKEIGKIDRDMAWALNAQAYAFDALGRLADAETIFDELAAIPFDADERGWLVNFVINRGSRLVRLGHFEKGLAAAEMARKIAAESGSGYANMLVRRDQVCALTGLGRDAEAAKILEEVNANADDLPSAAVEALLCANEEGKAAALVISSLRNLEKVSDMAEALQKPEFGLSYSTPVLPTLSARMRPRKDVDLVFHKVARDLPERLVPLAGQRRAKLAAGGASRTAD